MTAKTDDPSANSRRAVWLAAALIILVILIAYHNCFSVPFLFDDEYAIQENGTIRHLLPISQVLSPPALPAVSGRPIVNLSLAINYALGRERVWGYHVFNLAVHILAALTLFGIVRRTLSWAPGLREHFGRQATVLAFTTAVLWAVHPLQTEAVTYLVQRAESLMGLFYLFTLYCFLRGAQSEQNVWCGLGVISCMLGMGTKEVMVSAPLIVLLFDRTFIAGSFIEVWRKRWKWYMGLMLGWVWLGYLVARSGEFGSGRAGFHTPIAWWPYVCTQFWAVMHYLRLIIWPHPLILDYGTISVTQVGRLVPGVALVGMLLVGTLISLRYWPIWGFLGAWFFLILAPTTSILPLAGQTVAEHRMYLPLAAVVVAGVMITYWFRKERGLILVGILGVIWTGFTLSRNSDYRSPVVIWGQAVAEYPDQARANANLGYALGQAGRLNEAIPPLRKALMIKPDFSKARVDLGAILALQGLLDEAINEFEQVLAAKPNDSAACYNLGNAYLQKNDFGKAIVYYQRALDVMPDNADARANLACVLVRKGQVAEAIINFRQALRAAPDNVLTLNNLAWILATSANASFRDGNQAVELARQASQITGNRNPIILKTLAASYAEADRFADAIETCQRALQYAGNQTALAQVLESQLKRYQNGLPLRSMSTNSELEK